MNREELGAVIEDMDIPWCCARMIMGHPHKLEGTMDPMAYISTVVKSKADAKRRNDIRYHDKDVYDMHASSEGEIKNDEGDIKHHPSWALQSTKLIQYLSRVGMADHDIWIHKDKTHCISWDQNERLFEIMDLLQSDWEASQREKGIFKKSTRAFRVLLHDFMNGELSYMMCLKLYVTCVSGSSFARVNRNIEKMNMEVTRDLIGKGVRVCKTMDDAVYRDTDVPFSYRFCILNSDWLQLEDNYEWLDRLSPTITQNILILEHTEKLNRKRRWDSTCWLHEKTLELRFGWYVHQLCKVEE